jgi:hypothetical protein
MSDKRKDTITKRGGYEPGPKTVSELRPPPKQPGAGSNPKSASPKGKGRDA